MADFISCDNNSLTLGNILASLFDVDTNGQMYLRVVAAFQSQEDTDVIECGNYQQFLVLFRQCIAVADDNRPALRLIATSFSNGTGLSSGHICGTQKDLTLLFRQCFSYTTTGEIAFNLATIT